MQIDQNLVKLGKGSENPLPLVSGVLGKLTTVRYTACATESPVLGEPTDLEYDGDACLDNANAIGVRYHVQPCLRQLSFIAHGMPQSVKKSLLVFAIGLFHGTYLLWECVVKLSHGDLQCSRDVRFECLFESSETPSDTWLGWMKQQAGRLDLLMWLQIHNKTSLLHIKPG